MNWKAVLIVVSGLAFAGLCVMTALAAVGIPLAIWALNENKPLNLSPAKERVVPGMIPDTGGETPGEPEIPIPLDRGNRQPGIAETWNPTQGLGFTPQAVRSLYEEFDFTFQAVDAIHDQPRQIGTDPSGAALIEITGPEEEMTAVALLVTVVGVSPSQVAANTAYTWTLLNLLAPDWEGSYEWFLSEMEQGVASRASLYEASIIRNDIEVTLMVSNSLGSFVLAFQSAP